MEETKNKKTTSSNTDIRKRLKERFKKTSLENFHINEVFEFLLSVAAPKTDVRSAAAALLKRFGNLRGVLDAGPDELRRVKGVGENASILISLVKGIAGEYLKEQVIGTDVIRCKKDLLAYLDLAVSGERVEKFLAVYLNSKNEVLSVDTLCEGTINHVVVHPRKAIEHAFRHNARAVIFVHNHPSGDSTPSDTDLELIQVLDRAAIAVDIIVLDHMIIGKDSHFSARENGWIAGYKTSFPMAAEP